MKRLLLLLVAFIALEANSPPIDYKEIDWEIVRQQDINRIEILTPQNVYDFLVRQNIQHVGIVFRQIIQETGHFTSKVCLQYNNLFGMTRTLNTVPPTVEYKVYTSWKESIMRYKDWQDHRIEHGWDLSDYYTFLEKVRYAEDPLYIVKLKSINLNRYGL